LKAVALSLALGIAAFGSVARADSKTECVASYDKAQSLRQSAHLRDAKRELLICAQPSCPEVVVRECAPWLEQLERDLPTVVLGARDGEGHDLRDVAVTLDGAPILARLDGSAIAVDPGTHELGWERKGVRIRSSVLVQMGEKNRLVAIRFGAAPPRRESLPVGPFVLGGIGVAAFVPFTILGISAKNKFDHLQATCSPNCSAAQLSPSRNQALAADIFLGAGIAAVVGATIWFIASPRRAPEPARDLALRF